ncbi:MAG: DUF424 family protein [Nanoarchaeota archaeon]|nr:DUF424 family protein [Nanoarchaeota archaeon]MBU1027634.1 DUF424 family protein [Nanoarchaeota archaeon]
MYIKIHKTYRDVIAICDVELLGQKFEEGKFQLDLKENFYGGNKQTQEEAIKIMKEFNAEDATFNIVGEKSIQTALQAGIITENSIGKIAGIPFTLILV